MGDDDLVGEQPGRQDVERPVNRMAPRTARQSRAAPASTVWSMEPTSAASLYQTGVRSTSLIPAAPSKSTVPRCATERRDSVTL